MTRFTVTILGLTTAIALALGAVPAAQAAAKPRYPVTVTLNSSETPKVGEMVKLSGKTSSKLSGESIEVDRKIGSGKWRKASSVKVSSKGSVATSIRAASAGEVAYRFSIPATKKHAASNSGVVSTTVYAYYYLSDLDFVKLDFYRKSAAIAGTTYFHSLLRWATAGQPLVAEYNMSYKCKSFTSTIGLDDFSDSRATLHDEVLADGVKIGEANLVPGKSVPVQYDMTGVFRLRLTSYTDSSSRTAYAAWGDAQVLCAGKP